MIDASFAGCTFRLFGAGLCIQKFNSLLAVCDQLLFDCLELFPQLRQFVDQIGFSKLWAAKTGDIRLLYRDLIKYL